MEDEMEHGEHCGHDMHCCHGMDQGMMGHGMMDQKMMMKHLFMKAKAELIKEKMKKKLEAAEGKKLDEMADLVVGMMMKKMTAMKDMMKEKEEMMAKMQAIFGDE